MLERELFANKQARYLNKVAAARQGLNSCRAGAASREQGTCTIVLNGYEMAPLTKLYWAVGLTGLGSFTPPTQARRLSYFVAGFPHLVPTQIEGALVYRSPLLARRPANRLT